MSPKIKTTRVTTPSTLVEVRRNSKGRGGRGVYALEDIKKGRIIEKCPCIIFPWGELQEHDLARLSWYVFCWPLPYEDEPEWKDKRLTAVALGNGSLYNHSYSASATFTRVQPDLIVFRAYRDIKKGEEITINYNGHPYDQSPMEFDVA